MSGTGKVRVWLGPGWWRWYCPCCPTKVGGLCTDHATAVTAADRHARTEHTPAAALDEDRILASA